MTPLLHAAAEGHTQCVSALLSCGALPDTPSPEGFTPLLLAAWGGHASGVVLLLAAGALAEPPALKPPRSNARSTAPASASAVAEWTPLLVAAQEGSLESVTALLAHGATVDRADPEGSTALMFACQGAHVAVLRLLLHSGASVQLRDAEGATALHSAVYGAQSCGRFLAACVGEDAVECVRLLLAAGADPGAKAAGGQTPAGMAAEAGGAVGVQLRRAMATAASRGAKPSGAEGWSLGAVENSGSEVSNVAEPGRVPGSPRRRFAPSQRAIPSLDL
jgi:ankyrin repeat protein